MTRCPRCHRRLSATGECTAHGRPTSIVDVEIPPPTSIVAPAGWQVGKHVATGGTAHVHVVERAGSPPAILKWARSRGRDIHARFARETEVLRLLGPPSTPAYVAHGEIEQSPYVIMEHVPGETLAAWMARNGNRGGLGEILAILTRVAVALRALHEAGFVHRDLKPENIMTGGKGTRLLDFGLAKPISVARPELTQIGAVVGTVHYLAPEQIKTGVVDQRADLYSLGVIAYEMLAGQPPFVGERRAIEYQHRVARPQSIRDHRNIPAELDELVLACLAKPPEARPQTVADFQVALKRSLDAISTIRGIGGARTTPSASRPLGKHGAVALVWIEGADPVNAARAITDMQGIVVRQRGAGMLAAFCDVHHDDPPAVALAAARTLVDQRCRIVVHAGNALVRRTPLGKHMVYGGDVEQVEAWLPSVPFSGLLLTSACAEVVRIGARPAGDVPGFLRERERDRTDITDVHETPSLIGPAIVKSVVAEATARALVVAITGAPGTGKSRVLDEIAAALRDAGREVIVWRTRRRFAGDRPDDDRLLEALGGADAPTAFAAAAKRRAVALIDDFDRLSTPLRARLCEDLAFTRIVTAPAPVFEVDDRASHRLAIELQPLAYDDAAALLRDQLRPATLVPDVLLERLAIRGAGNPGLLLALARDMKARGAIRRHAGSDEWYVAADELDTLLAPPSPAWLAQSALDQLPLEIAPLVQTCAALGPRFCADELAHVIASPGFAGTRSTPEGSAESINADPRGRLAWLVAQSVFVERAGWYEFADANLQDAIYDYVTEGHEVHARAFAFWVAHRSANVVGWLARLRFHAARCGEPATAATCAIALAGEAERRGELDHRDLLLARATATLAPATVPVVRDVLADLAQ